ncbi:MAG: superoxide dismutase [Candidatus Omnitrophica bacterium]|nr:superoxide dismutase [Candidatus Omnitrophota bacterium]
MLIKLPELPYAKAALEPYISAKTFEFHHGKHHAGYVEKLNGLVKGTPLAEETLENIIKKTSKNESQSAIFNNAAQVWNHSFYWQCMKPKGGGIPTGAILDKLKSDLGGYNKFVEEFKAAGISQFGSGWVWLVLKGKKLEIAKTSNADTPIAHGFKPLLTVDVWEHAYYLDYQNKRGDYLDAYMKNLINWDFINLQLI